jgi:hypothetical protein
MKFNRSKQRERSRQEGIEDGKGRDGRDRRKDGKGFCRRARRQRRGGGGVVALFKAAGRG